MPFSGSICTGCVRRAASCSSERTIDRSTSIFVTNSLLLLLLANTWVAIRTTLIEAILGCRMSGTSAFGEMKSLYPRHGYTIGHLTRLDAARDFAAVEIHLEHRVRLANGDEG